ncbi:hypothetical protein L6164_025415 [Bauhinia variegata]|uniref:Uncharacterized protein n=1 Tax=Bauhinia variegata TaxID=167791 RepID=A0ACB9M344_BAUVA|nr:hypothetical protein L6164_025415 [Bauhinia variegata]
MQDRKKRYAILGLSSFLLEAMVAILAITVNNKDVGSSQIFSSHKNVEMLCQPATYKETCKNTLAKASNESSDPKELVKIGLNVTVDELKKIINNSTLYKELAEDNMTREAVDICKEVMEFAIDNFYQSIDKLSSFDLSKLGVNGAFFTAKNVGFENAAGPAKLQAVALHGLGADTSKRVAWPGVKVLTAVEASDFYPQKFYDHKDVALKDSWILASGVPYSPGQNGSSYNNMHLD